jgi:hypothetical protein
MIKHGLFKILDLYSNEIFLFYNNIDKHFREKINNFIRENTLEKKNSDQTLKKLLIFFVNNFIELGFEREEIENSFSNPLLEIRNNDFGKIASIKKLYKKLIPIVYEIFLEKILNYLVDINADSIILNLKSKGLLPIEFIMELKDLKSLFKKSQKKKENLLKFIQIRKKIIHKFRESKSKIERLENLKDPRDRLQLSYMIYRIIDFFSIQKLFDFSYIKEYIKNNCDEWLDTIPLVSLKNPDLYFCGIYLAKHLSISIDEDNIKYFLLNIYDENIDEFESPIIEATNQVYYFFKSCLLINFLKEISDAQIKELLKGEQKFFDTLYLKNLETSRLVLILKIYNILGIYHKIDPRRIKAILNEIERRITSNGIKQYRDGFSSSEATYFVLFCNYMRNELKSLKDYNLLDKIISKIYRNLEILDFSQEINYDLVSELFYSCESLKLLNCIETKQMITLLAKDLFPQEVISKILNNEEIIGINSRLRNLKVCKITGEMLY